jgi:hypothetical protein
MLHTISISEPIYNLLNQEAKRTRLSPNDLAERLLAERLSAFDPAEIETDITAASEEVKARRH